MSTTAEAIYVPAWDGLVSEWTRATIHRNAWRVAAEFDPEDLEQEAFLIFAKVEAQYRQAFMGDGRAEYEKLHPRRRPTRANFFALYKLSVIRRFEDLSRRHQLRNNLLAPPIGDDEGTLEQAVSDDVLTEVLLEEIISTAPVALQGLLRAELAEDLVPAQKVPAGRETRNQRLARMAGVPVDALDGLQKKIEKWARTNLAPTSSAVCHG